MYPHPACRANGPEGSPRRVAVLLRTTLAVLGAAALLCALPVGSSLAEDGYRLWLRYAPLPAEQRNRLDRATGGLLYRACATAARAIEVEVSI